MMFWHRHHLSRQTIDAAYVAAMRHAIDSGEGKRAPTTTEVARYLTDCRRCRLTIARLMPVLHRLHGVR